MTLAEKVSQMQNTAPAIPRLNVPAYDWWNEALHGVARAGLATVFPQAIGLAATWDTDLQFRIADAISTEARAKYNDAIAHGNHHRYYGLTFWSPNINIFRDPRWGRGQETYGESPYLTAQMAIAFIKGMQGNDPHYLKTIATSKHFAVHSGPELLRHKFNVDPSEEDLKETYLYAFKRTVEDGGVQSIMCAYNALKGVPACASSFLLSDTLRNAWHFNGYVTSDCGAIDDVFRGHHYAKSLAEAAADSVKAGTDLDCGTEYKNLPDAVHQGYITEAAIDRSLVRLFTARFRLGMFDPPDRVPFSKIGMDQVESMPHQKLALEAAEKSIVLLKNRDDILPLLNIPRNIAVVGPTADDPNALLGNYNGIPSHIVTPLKGIEEKFAGRANVRFALGTTYVNGWSALVPQNVLTPPGGTGVHGLLVEYFDGPGFQGAPKLSRVEDRGYFNWDMQDPAIIHAITAKSYSIRWSGTITIDQSGDYKLGFVRAECHSCGRTDSARLYVDDRLLVNVNGKSGEATYPQTAAIHFESGKAYKIRLEYEQSGGGGGVELLWAPPADAAFQQALNLVKNSDLTILCLGLNSRLEGEESKVDIPGFDGGDRTDIRLPQTQEKFAEAVLNTGKPTIAILVNGSALAVNTLQQRAQAVIEAWYGGQEAGTAIANTLSGENNPAGRLPVTFYQSLGQLPPFTDYSMKNRTYRYFTGQPLYPFGFGLSYSKFKYSNLRVKASSSGIEVTATIQNQSRHAGDEVAQLYLTEGKATRPILRGFKRLHLNQGEHTAVTFLLNSADLEGRDHVSVGSGQPVQQWTGNQYVQAGLPK